MEIFGSASDMQILVLNCDKSFNKFYYIFMYL